MKSRLKIEMLVVTFFTFAIVIIAPMIFKIITNDTGKMIIKPLLYIFLAGMPFVVCNIMKNSIWILGFKKRRILKQVLIGVKIFILIAFIFSIVVFILSDEKGMLLGRKQINMASIIYYIVFYILFVGMGEEILFRGYFMERFRILTDSKVWAVVISSLLFGIWHFPNGQDFLQVILATLIGAIYGLAKLKIYNCSTLSLGIAHGLHDVYIFILTSFLL